ncbi:hypothetical protein [Thiolinea disciformis]|uniref:hypothetical protein n=1 Tax=Thiolinea disciformis TaxID=125614 RepID=UPI00037EC8E8|nr:hypothetical protein [Thiolinea disciformis]
MVNSSPPLRIALLHISPQNRSILEFFFAGAGKHLFHLTQETEAEVLLIDFDFPGSEQVWQQRQGLHKPLIALAMREIQPDHGIWLAKPLTFKSMIEVAERVRSLVKLPDSYASKPSVEADDEQPTAQFKAPPQNLVTSTQAFGLGHTTKKYPALVIPVEDEEETPTTPKPQSLFAQPEPEVEPSESNVLLHRKKTPEPLPEPDPLQLEQRWRQLCGSRADIHPSQWRTSALLYNTDQLLQHNLKEALKLARSSNQPVQLKIDLKDSIVLLPQTQQALTSLDIYSERFSDLCTQTLQAGRVQMYIPDVTEIERLPAHLKNYSYDLEALIWTLSLLSSNGRIPQSANLDQRMILTYWPNFTRLEFIPHAMRLAAAWQQRAGTAFEIAQGLNIPQRYIFAFYNATTMLDLLVAAQETTEVKESDTPKKNRGLFSRLLKRLLGGGKH